MANRVLSPILRCGVSNLGDYRVSCFNITIFFFSETGKILSMAIVENLIQGHTCISNIESSSITMYNKTMYLMLYTMNEIKIYDLENFEQKYELNCSHDNDKNKGTTCSVSSSTSVLDERKKKLQHNRGVQRPATNVQINGCNHHRVCCKNYYHRKKQKPGFIWECWSTDSTILYAGFVPNTNKIIIGRSNDTIQIWTWAFRALKQTINIFRMRLKYLRVHPVIQLEPFYDSDEAEVDEVIKTLTKDLGKSVISDICFSKNGCYCSVVLEYLNEVIIFITSTATTTHVNRNTAKNTSLSAATVFVPSWEIYKVRVRKTKFRRKITDSYPT